jgi:hypothetical protein
LHRRHSIDRQFTLLLRISQEVNNMKNERMDRGTEAMLAHLTSDLAKLEIRQTRKGWCQELLGCEAQTELKYFINGTQVAESLEDANCFCRVCCAEIHPFKMTVKEVNTEAELLSVERPCACKIGPAKCCCYQTAHFFSGQQKLGTIKEDCWWCVPGFKVNTDTGTALYKIHPPTCCGGCCVNCCAEGNPCTNKGCCRESFRVYPAEQQKTNGDAPYVGVILKKPKSAMVEIFTDADVFEVEFPKDSTAEQKSYPCWHHNFYQCCFL